MIKNKVREKIFNGFDFVQDLLGWITAGALAIELWIKASDHTLLTTMWPIIIVMVTFTIYNTFFPHVCDDDCEGFVKRGTEH